MDEATARAVRDLGIQIMAMLDTHLGAMKEQLSDEELVLWRRRIGRAMGAVSCELIDPAIALHPQLDPSREEWIEVATRTRGSSK